MDTPALRTTETKSADATKMPPRRFDLTRLLTQRDRLPWFWFFFTVAVLLLPAVERYHIVSQFKQRERVVIIDPARDPGAVKSNWENPNGISIIQPKVARNELPWVIVRTNSPTLKGLHQSHTYRSSNSTS